MSFKYLIHKNGRFFRKEFTMMMSFYYGHGDIVSDASNSYVVWNPSWWRMLPFTNPKLFIKNQQ